MGLRDGSFENTHVRKKEKRCPEIILDEEKAAICMDIGCCRSVLCLLARWALRKGKKSDAQQALPASEVTPDETNG
jgi:hypothetical protein